MILKKKLKEDAVSLFHKYLSCPSGLAISYVARMNILLGFKLKGLRFLLASIRYCDSGKAISLLGRVLEDETTDLTGLLSVRVARKDAEGRAIILSLPKMDNEKVVKGVILLTFTHTFSYYISHSEWSRLDGLFVFVLEPSWAGYADADIIEFVRKFDHCVVQASELRDRSLLNSLYPGVPCLDTGASNWIDYSVFTTAEENEKKDIDIIYVANGNPIKRVFRAVDAISEAVESCPDYRCVIICAGWGGGNEELQEYIKNNGLAGNIDLLDGMSQKQLVGFLNRSKASMMLSLKEGSNRVLFESMFANVPVICLSENVGVNKSYINSFTGLLVHDRLLPKALLHMREEYNKYSPRIWALDNISPEVTTKRLAYVLRQYYGSVVNDALQIKVNSPEVKYRDLAIKSQDVTKYMMSILSGNENSYIVDRLEEKYGSAWNSV